MRKTIYSIAILFVILFFSTGCKEQIKYTYVEQIETSIEFIPVNEHEGNTDAEIILSLQSNAQLREDAIRLYYKIADAFELSYFVLDEDGLYKSHIPKQATGHDVPYYIEVITAGGTRKAFPESAPENTFLLTFKGHAPYTVKWVYRLALIASLALFLIAGYLSYLSLYKGQERFDLVIQLLMWGTGIFFIGVFLFGMVYSYFVWRSLWGMTANTTIFFIFLFWSLSLFSVKGSAFQLDDTKNLLSINLFEQIVLAGSILTPLILSVTQFFVPGFLAISEKLTSNTSLLIRWKLGKWANFSWRISHKRRSISIAVTVAPVSTRRDVSAPSPGPISTT